MERFWYTNVQSNIREGKETSLDSLHYIIVCHEIFYEVFVRQHINWQVHAYIHTYIHTIAYIQFFIFTFVLLPFVAYRKWHYTYIHIYIHHLRRNMDGYPGSREA